MVEESAEKRKGGGRRLGSRNDSVSGINHDEMLRLRLERGWSQVQLARAADLSKSTISLIETHPAHRVSQMSLIRIAEALEVNPSSLLGSPSGDEYPLHDALHSLKILVDRTDFNQAPLPTLIRDVDTAQAIFSKILRAAMDRFPSNPDRS